MIISQPFSLPLVSATGVFGAELLPRVTGYQYWIYSFFTHHDQDEAIRLVLISQTPYKILVEFLVQPLFDRSFVSYGRRDLCLTGSNGGNVYLTSNQTAIVAGLIQYELLRARGA